MREILFRGKSVNSGEWVRGYYFESFSGVPYIMTRHDHITRLTDYYEVDPETVGQYTVLKDKKKGEIFEGDIVYCVSRFDHAKMVVLFEDGEFRMVLCEKYETYKTGSGFYALRCFEKEIIGNIHDNPELLEVGE